MTERKSGRLGATRASWQILYDRVEQSDPFHLLPLTSLLPPTHLKMAPYNPMKKHMEKLDEWGSSANKKFASTRNTGPGSSMTDRFNAARGKDDRWEKSKPVRAEDDDQTNIVPQRSGRVDHLPQAPSSFIGGKAPPPPPPQRGLGTGQTSDAPPAPPARGRAPPPALPRRMDNESGIDRPPPAYGNSNTSAVPATETTGYIEFTKFTEQDKQAFFLLLDEVSR